MCLFLIEQDLLLMIINEGKKHRKGREGDDASTFQTNRWYHVAYAFEESTQQQYTYVNGYVDGQRTSNQYSGQAGNFTIGTSSAINTPNNYFQGYFDEMSLVPYSKTGAQILDDATHVVYYKFDSSPSIQTDSGPLQMSGNAVGASLALSPAKANESLYFPQGTNYFQFQGLVLFSYSNWPYSFSLWIYPLSINGGTLVHAHGGYTTNGVGTTDWCLPMLGFSSTGILYAQSTLTTSSLIVLTGPTIITNTWTHTVVTYSTTNGLCLYSNDSLQNSSSAFSFTSSGSPNTITIGNSLSGFNSTYCPQGSIQTG